MSAWKSVCRRGLAHARKAQRSVVKERWAAVSFFEAGGGAKIVGCFLSFFCCGAHTTDEKVPDFHLIIHNRTNNLSTGFGRLLGGLRVVGTRFLCSETAMPFGFNPTGGPTEHYYYIWPFPFWLSCRAWGGSCREANYRTSKSEQGKGQFVCGKVI